MFMFAFMISLYSNKISQISDNCIQFKVALCKNIYLQLIIKIWKNSRPDMKGRWDLFFKANSQLNILNFFSL